MEFRIKDYVQSPFGIVKTATWMHKAPHLSKEEMDKRLIVQLRELCKYAYKHVPFYKEWFDNAEFVPEKIDSFDYFEKIPILTKDIVRERHDDLISDEADKLHAVDCTTTGSTGTPLHFLLDMNVNAARFLLFLRAWDEAPDWNIFKSQATISQYEKGEWHYSKLSKILYLSSIYLSDKNVTEYYHLIKKYKVRFLRGYPSSLCRFAELLNKHNLHLEFKVVFSGAETLMLYQREYIEKTFHAKVIDHYTIWESVASICECMDGSLHAENDFGYHEIVDNHGHKKEHGIGRLVCTGLYNKAMPLIRYDTRDLAEWGGVQCSCGNQFPVVKTIIGRVDDAIYTPDGRRVERLTRPFNYCKNIRLAYIYQPSIEKMIVNICPADNFDYCKEISALESELRKRVGDQISIEYKLINESDVPLTKTGKVRFVISDVTREIQTTTNDSNGQP